MRPRPAPRSLQSRLLALVLGLVVGVWLATAAMTWADARGQLGELLDAHLAQAAALLVVQQGREVEDDEDHGLDAPTLHRYAPKVAFQVFHEGRLALRSANAPLAPMVAASEGLQSGFKTVSVQGATWRVFATRGAERDVQVYVGEEARSRDAILWAVLRSTLWPMALALPLLGLAVWWAVRQGMGPLRRLGRVLGERPAQSIAPVHIEAAPAEMTPLLAALNALLGRIGGLLESERRFTADAAHELRTPIAAIRTQAQVAMGEADPALRRHALQNTLAGCDRATRLVTQLLTLARLEGEGAGAAAVQKAPLDLCALTQRVLADLAPQALSKGQEVALDAAPPCLVWGDETLLGVLVRNLVDNAVRYSPAGAKVAVAVQPLPEGGVRLTVQDSGPGLSPAEQARLGERFFRALGQPESGSGLGWSIVQRIAAVHPLTLQVQASDTLGGLAVSVCFAPIKDGA